MTDYQEPFLANYRASTYLHPLHRLKRSHWWILVILNITLLVVGQAVAVLLGRFYYDKGGNSTWMATLIQSVAFPLLLIPYFLLRFYDDTPPISSTRRSIFLLCTIYLVIGALTSVDYMLYSIGLLYLSASTYSLICATQLAFNAVLSYFINQQKFTMLILNSVVIISLSAALIALNDGSDAPSGVNRKGYIIGVFTTLVASALYSLLLSLMQLTFEKILKKETFHVVLEMQILIAMVSTCVSILGLFASGDWRTLRGEMDGFISGRVSYFMTLVWTAVAWQVCSVGVAGLIFVVSSLFSNVISTLSLVVTPIASLIVFHDQMNGVKIVAMLMAFWGFASYIYQNYIDDILTRKNRDGGNNNIS